MSIFDFFRSKKTIQDNGIDRLLLAKKQLLEENTEVRIFALLSELRRSEVIIPGRIDGEDSFHPDLLARDDILYFPIFSSEKEIPDTYKNRFSMLSMPTRRVLEFAHQIAKEDLRLKGLVLDPFTELVEIDFPAADMMDVD